MNAPERYEVTTLPEGVDRITVSFDPRLPNAAVYQIQLEDHTMGNLIRMFDLK